MTGRMAPAAWPDAGPPVVPLPGVEFGVVSSTLYFAAPTRELCDRQATALRRAGTRVSAQAGHITLTIAGTRPQELWIRLYEEKVEG